jgi:hypothetical protein
VIKIIVKVVTSETCYRICFRKIFPVPNTSTFLQTALATEAYLADGQFVHEGENFNSAKFLKYLTGTRRPTISKTEGQNVRPRQTWLRQCQGNASSYGGCAIVSAPEREKNGTQRI